MSLVRELFSGVLQPVSSSGSMSKTQLQTEKKRPRSGKKDHQVVVKKPGPSKIPRCGGGPDFVLPPEALESFLREIAGVME